MHDVHSCWKHGIRKRNKNEHKSGKLFLHFLADRTNVRAYATELRPSVVCL